MVFIQDNVWAPAHCFRRPRGLPAPPPILGRPAACGAPRASAATGAPSRPARCVTRTNPKGCSRRPGAAGCRAPIFAALARGAPQATGSAEDRQLPPAAPRRSPEAMVSSVPRYPVSPCLPFQLFRQNSTTQPVLHGLAWWLWCMAEEGELGFPSVAQRPP